MLIGNLPGGRKIAVLVANMSSAEQLPGGQWSVNIDDGSSITFSNDEWQVALARTPRSTFPALPGTYLVTANTDDDNPPYWRDNVVGWMISLAGTVRPIVIDPEVAIYAWTVVHPDGRVESNCGRSWDNAESWLREIKERA